MTKTTLSAPFLPQNFPAGTADAPATFTVTGTLFDGTAFSQVVTGADPSVTSATFELTPGTFTGLVSKLGVSSLPSAPFVVDVPATVVLSAPDGTKPATLG